MRDYGIVSPKFWIGETGKSLRGNPAAQVLALYLMTCPHANMIGVFHCPIVYMMHETGLDEEGASKALASLIEAHFCTYEEASETVFVHRMAAFQIAERLKPDDKRVKGVEREWSNIDSKHIKSKFFAIYSIAFHLPKEGEEQSPIEAPCKPHASQEQDQDQEQDQEEAKASLSEPGVPPCPIDSLIDKFTQRLPMLPGIRKSLFKAGKNADAMRSRWRWVMTAEHEKGERKGLRLATTAAEGIDWFDKYFSFVAESDFLTGANGKWTACDLAWLLTASKFEAVLSGKYHQKEEVTA